MMSVFHDISIIINNKKMNKTNNIGIIKKKSFPRINMTYPGQLIISILRNII